MTKHVHIDGDVIVYTAGFAAEKGQYVLHRGSAPASLDPEFFQYKKDLDKRLEELGTTFPHMVEFERRAEPVEYALSNAKNMIESIVKETNASIYSVYLSGRSNYRDAIGTIREYKGNRDKSHKPIHAPDIRDYLARVHRAITSVDEEADDLIGINHYRMYKEDIESTCIASIDKDLDMIPGEHFNFYKGKNQSYFVWDAQADANFYRQLLTGDTTDNVVGVPRIGPKKAEQILSKGLGSPLSMYQVVREEYKKAYVEKADEALLENARLLWIRREPGQMWNPPEGDKN